MTSRGIRRRDCVFKLGDSVRATVTSESRELPAPKPVAAPTNHGGRRLGEFSRRFSPPSSLGPQEVPDWFGNWNPVRDPQGDGRVCRPWRNLRHQILSSFEEELFHQRDQLLFGKRQRLVVASCQDGEEDV
ncbi:hypothetical protein HPB47_000757 [Ixodes persulcatus]|uniref:Uncharacterized protein n=1 Tax=Ixodes persulcatus TaxID=34615 RepID=A0AC60PR75_IXOPE|nr:hypothetical protein HPB47_000757 [Ixodes persulcatus]